MLFNEFSKGELVFFFLIGSGILIFGQTISLYVYKIFWQILHNLSNTNTTISYNNTNTNTTIFYNNILHNNYLHEVLWMLKIWTHMDPLFCGIKRE